MLAEALNEKVTKAKMFQKVDVPKEEESFTCIKTGKHIKSVQHHG